MSDLFGNHIVVFFPRGGSNMNHLLPRAKTDIENDIIYSRVASPHARCFIYAFHGNKLFGVCVR